MSQGIGISFRILHPDPFGFSLLPVFSPEIQCLVEFSSENLANRFEVSLLNWPQIRHVRLEKGKPNKVFWTMFLVHSSTLVRLLKSIPQIALQIETGLN